MLVDAGWETEMNTAVEGPIVDTRVLGFGVDVIVVSLSDIEVTNVVGLGVDMIVLKEPPIVVITVNNRGMLPVGVVTNAIVVGVPPITEVNSLRAGVLVTKVSLPSMVVLIVSGASVAVKTPVLPPTWETSVKDTGLKPAAFVA